jgi:hypothetical protein
MKYSDDTDDHRAANLAYANERWRQLYGLQNDWGTEGIKFLFLVNSGATGAMLAFLGSVTESRKWGWPIAVLAFFAVGVVLIGFLHALRHYHILQLFKKWRESVNEYYTDQKGWGEIINADVTRSARFDWSLVVAYASFSCFIIGIIIGMFNFSTLTSGDSNGRKETNTTTSAAETISTRNTNPIYQGRPIEEKGSNANHATASARPEKEIKQK